MGCQVKFECLKNDYKKMHFVSKSCLVVAKGPSVLWNGTQLRPCIG